MNISMGMIKIEINFNELVKAVEVTTKKPGEILNLLTNELKKSASMVMDQLLNSEMTVFLGKPEQINNKRNGYYEREYVLKHVGAIKIRMPIDRKREFESKIIPKSERVDPRIKEDLAFLHLAGLSTRTISLMSQRLLGLEVSTDTVSKSLGSIKEQAISWLERPIEKKYWALYVDGTNFNISRNGSSTKEPSLVVVGVDENNCRSILAIEPGYKDNAETWKAVFNELIARGLDMSKVQLGIMDGLPGLEKCFKEVFPHSQTARCWAHSSRNAMSRVSKKIQPMFKKYMQKIMYANGREAAQEAFEQFKEQMTKDAEKGVRIIEKDLLSLLAHYSFPKELWPSLRTTNPIERVNKELKRRTKVMDGLGENTLRCIQAFVAMKMELTWIRSPISSGHFSHMERLQVNRLEKSFENLLRAVN